MRSAARMVSVGVIGVVLVGCSVTASASVDSPAAIVSFSPTPLESPLPTPRPDATVSPSLAPDALDLGGLGWQLVIPELDPVSQQTIGHTLAVGTLNREPVLSQHLDESPWAFTLYAEQEPVVDGPTAGKVLYVSDDGVRSEVRLTDIHGATSTVLGTTNDVVFTARLTPDGAAAYLVLLERATGQDRGVFRLDRDGDGSPQFVMGPPSVDQSQAAGGIRLVATSRFVRTLRISPDGSQLARVACGEPFGECVFDVMQIADNTITHYNNPGQLSSLVAVGDGYLLAGGFCDSSAGCVTDAMGLTRGMPEQIVADSLAVDAQGHLALLSFRRVDKGTTGISATNLGGGASSVVFVTDGEVRPLSSRVAGFDGGQLELPWGWAAALLDLDKDHDVPIAVRLTDGGWVRLNLPSLYPIGGGHD